MSSVLVTGGAGFIGAHTCIELLENGFDIVIMDNFYNSKPEALNRIKEITGKDFKFYNCDMLDREGLEKIFNECDIESVIHFAGLKSPTESVSIPLTYYYNNITGTLTLCEVMKKHGVKNLVFSSSATVYGQDNEAPLLEDMKTGGCINAYGQTKFMIELILKDLYVSDNDWNITLLRYFNPVGAHVSGRIGEDPQGIPINLMPLITRVAVGRMDVLKITGTDYPTPDGTCIRDYVHVVDLAKGHLKALAAQKKKGGLNTYNLGTGKGSSVLDIVKAFEKANNIKLNYEYAPRRPGDLAVSYASVQKAKDELDFTAEYDLVRMCEDSWRWQSMNPNGL
ncbi:udp-glucose 4-epimerase [Holotrichia oblita]|nr:udp-glucose 4-epimerase [Holotrichia oblita]